MADMTQKSNSGSMIASTAVATATHALIPAFWLFCSLFIMPRYYNEIASRGIEKLPESVNLLFSFSHFMANNSLTYMFLVVLFLIVDGAVYYSLQRVSKSTVARLWSLGIVVVQISLSLYLYLPLRSTVENTA